MTPSSRRWSLAAALWAAAIFVSGVVPTRSTVQAVSGGHDWATTTASHFLVYAVLGFLLCVATGGWQVRRGPLLAALLLAAVLGGAIELLQGPLPYRDTQLSDFIVDVAGAAVGIGVFSAAARARRSRSHRG